mgnify:CR=1 FL=1
MKARPLKVPFTLKSQELCRLFKEVAPAVWPRLGLELAASRQMLTLKALPALLEGAPQARVLDTLLPAAARSAQEILQGTCTETFLRALAALLPEGEETALSDAELFRRAGDLSFYARLLAGARELPLENWSAEL